MFSIKSCKHLHEEFNFDFVSSLQTLINNIVSTSLYFRFQFLLRAFNYSLKIFTLKFNCNCLSKIQCDSRRFYL